MTTRTAKHKVANSRSAESGRERHEAVQAEMENENPAAVTFSGDPRHDPAAEVRDASSERAALPPSSTLRPGNEEAAAVGEAFLDLEATPPRPEQSLPEESGDEDDDEKDIVFEEDEDNEHEAGVDESPRPSPARGRPLE